MTTDGKSRTKAARTADITRAIGCIPYRMAFAGGWIDQGFVSRHNPSPPGSMVVVGLQPTVRFMDRCGMATSTRNLALKLWPQGFPEGDPMAIVRRLYEEENRGQANLSGSQDMIGLVWPGVSRLDYDFAHEQGVFPVHIETCRDPSVARWLERVIHMIPVEPRPIGYNPRDGMRLDPGGVKRLGQTGRDCYGAILRKDAVALGASMNACMECWESLLPSTVRHPTLTLDLVGLLRHYQERFPGAMYSGCGGGYLYVVSEEPIPGAFKVSLRA